MHYKMKISHTFGNIAERIMQRNVPISTTELIWNYNADWNENTSYIDCSFDVAESGGKE